MVKHVRTVDIRPFLVELLSNLTEPEQLFYELVQNAADDGTATKIDFAFSSSDLTVSTNGQFSKCTNFTSPDNKACNFDDGTRSCDFHRLENIQNAEKASEAETTGAFGIGFNAIFRVTDNPELISSGIHLFFLNNENSQYTDTCEESGCKRNCANSQGTTTLILPWATNSESKGRQFYQQPAIKPADCTRYEAATLDSAPMALLFNKNLERISVKTQDGTIRQWARETDEQTVTIHFSGLKQRWRLFSRDLRNDDEFNTKHHGALGEIKGRERVEIAVCEDDGDTTDSSSHQESGRIFVTFPTGVKTHLPIHINAKFHPERSRRRLKVDGELGEWNKDVVAQAGRLIATEIPAIRDALSLTSPTRFWDLIAAAWTNKERGPDELGITNYWEDSLKEALRAHEIIKAESGEWCKVDGVRSRSVERDDQTTEHEDELAVDVLNRLGVETVHRQIQQKSHSRIFKELEIKELDLSHLAKNLADSELIGEVEQFVELIGGKPSLVALWRECNRLLPSGSKGAPIRDLALWPTAAGSYLPASKMYRADDNSEIQRLVEVFGLAVDFLADDMPSDLKRLREVVEDFKLGGLVDAMEASTCSNSGKLVHVGNEDRNGLFQWILDHKEEIEGDPSLKDRLRSLPLYPTKNEPCSLKDARRPTGFKDRLGIAKTIDMQALEGVEELLDLLDAESLNFETYCTSLLPEFFEKQPVKVNQRRSLVQELTKHLDAIGENELVREALEPLRIVECDGSESEFLPGGQVYFASEYVEQVLRNGVPVAVEPKSADTRELLELLGVTDRPRLSDVVEAVEDLSRKAVDKTTILQTRHTVEFLASAIPKSRDDDPDYDLEGETHSFKEELATLKELNWLPSVDQDEWWRPSALSARISENLFADQARFLHLNKESQKSARPFLEWLGVQVDPKPEQVVDQLSHCAKLGKRVDLEVYKYLDKQAEREISPAEPHGDPVDTTLFKPLERTPCLLVDPEGKTDKGTDGDCKYLSAHEVYQSEPNLGKYRYQLDHYYLQFKNLLNALGVKISPDTEDVQHLLPEITASHGDAPMDEEAKGVIRACWKLLEDKLCEAKDSERDGSPDDLARLKPLFQHIGHRATFFDQDSIAKRPDLLVLNDWNARAAYLKDESLKPLVEENEFMNALREAGAKNLSTDLQFTIIEDDLLEDDLVPEDQPKDDVAFGVVEQLEERWHLLERVFGWDEVIDRDALGRLRVIRGRVEVKKSTRLRANLSIPGILSQNDVEINAFFNGETKELFYLSGDSPPWADIAKEVIAALTNPPQKMLIPHIEAALGAETVQDADRKLDGFEVPRLHVPERPKYPSPVATVGHPVDSDDALVEPDPDLDGDAVADAESSDGSGFEPDFNSYGDSGFEDEENIEPSAGLDSAEDAAEDPSQGSPDEDADWAPPNEDSEYQEGAGEVSGEYRQPNRRQNRWKKARGEPKELPADRPSNERDTPRSPPPQRHTIHVGQSQPAGPSNERSQEIGREGEEAVIEYEKRAGREPVNMNDPNADGSNRQHSGYDIESKSSPGEEVERYIEVKVRTGEWLSGDIALTAPQLEAAKELGAKYWLYVIEHLGATNQAIYPIRDPYGLLDGFYFGPEFKADAE